jgi:hypothetical protein
VLWYWTYITIGAIVVENISPLKILVFNVSLIAGAAFVLWSIIPSVARTFSWIIVAALLQIFNLY